MHQTRDGKTQSLPQRLISQAERTVEGQPKCYERGEIQEGFLDAVAPELACQGDSKSRKAHQRAGIHCPGAETRKAQRIFKDISFHFCLQAASHTLS